MSVNRDESGRRWVSSEVVVPGTPEEVWAAIATGPGVSSWFYPTDLEEKEGGQLVCHMGPGMDAEATIREWNPPQRFVADGSWGPGAPTVATEWIVEALDGGQCRVRVVHSLFADTDDWDNQLESTGPGWEGYFGVLRLYLERFAGQPCESFTVGGPFPQPEDKAWTTLTMGLGLTNPAAGDDWSRDKGVVSGTVVRNLPGRLLLHADAPAPGIVSAIAFGMGDQTLVSLACFCYGPDAKATAEREQPKWKAWMAEHFGPEGN